MALLANRWVRHVLAEGFSRLVVLGDPHGDVAAVRSVLDRETDGRTAALCVGDAIGYSDGALGSAVCRELAARGVLTVQGNHEDWLGRGGTVVFVRPEGADARLSAEAVAWIRELSHAIDLVRKGEEARFATLVHSIRHPHWDWIQVDTIGAFLASLGNPPLVLVGHSHRPRFVTVSSEGAVTKQVFEFDRQEEVGLPLPSDGTLLVDAGSLGRPEVEGVARSEHGRHLGDRFGTYAVVDLASGEALLRRIEKPGP